MIRWGINAVRRKIALGRGFKGDIATATPFPTSDLEDVACGLAQRAYRKQRGKEPAVETVEVLAPYALFLMRKSGLFVAEPQGQAAVIAQAYSFTEWAKACVGLLRIVVKHLPADVGVNAAEIEVEGWSLSPNAHGLIKDVATYMLKADSLAAGPMRPWVDKILSRADAMKGVEPELLPDADAFPQWKEQPVDIMEQLFRGTPLKTLLRVWVPISIPDEALRCHAHVMGTTGSGKTTFNEATIMPDIGKKGIVIFDTKGGVFERLARHSGLAEHIVHINATSSDMRPVFNIAQPPIGATKDKVAKMISFVLAGLEIEMTALEASSFEMLAKILVEIPNANIYTLLDIIADKQHIEPYYDRLPENVRQWLKTQYDSDGVERSRKGTAQKIWSIVNSDMIGDLLTGDRNTFDPARLLNARKTIVITIDKKVVLENTSVIARCFIASLVSAMWARSLPITNEPGWRFIFDEFKDIVGPKDNSQPRSVLEQGREFDVSCQIAHQQIDQQLGNDMASTVVTNTHINAYANIDPKDARRIAPKLGVRTEDLLNFSKTEQYGYFCLWINGYIPKGVKCRVRFGHMQARPRLPDEHFRELVEAHRSFWARVNNKVQRVTPLRAVQDGDDAKLVHLVRDDQPKSMANVPWMQ